MNFSKPRFGLLFVAAFVVCFDFHRISALVRETGDGLRREGTVEHTQPIRGKRSIQLNATHPSLSDIAKRLLVVEKRQVIQSLPCQLVYKNGLILKDIKISLFWSLARNRRTKALALTKKNGKGKG